MQLGQGVVGAVVERGGIDDVLSLADLVRDAAEGVGEVGPKTMTNGAYLARQLVSSSKAALALVTAAALSPCSTLWPRVNVDVDFGCVLAIL